MTYPSTHSPNIFYGKTFEISFLSYFDICKTILLIIVNSLYNKSQHLFLLAIWNLPFDNNSSFPVYDAQTLIITFPLSISVSSTLLDSTYRWDYAVFFFLCLSCLIWRMASRFILVDANGCMIFLKVKWYSIVYIFYILSFYP